MDIPYAGGFVSLLRGLPPEQMKKVDVPFPSATFSICDHSTLGLGAKEDMILGLAMVVKNLGLLLYLPRYVNSSIVRLLSTFLKDQCAMETTIPFFKRKSEEL